MSSMPQFVNVPVFAGQGTVAVHSSQTRQQALRDAAKASGAFLLTACHQAFHAEFAALSSTELAEVDIDITDFSTPESLLAIPADRYLNNAVVSGTTLFLIQSLRYLAYIEASGVTTGSITPFSDALKENVEQGLGVVGFSSGILPACVVATSQSTLTYISNAVESYRLAFWIGIRCQQHRISALTAEDGPGKECTEPWSLAVLGLDKKAVEGAVAAFQSENTALPALHVTAVTDETCVTVSGRGDVLALFSASLPAGFPVHKTTVDALYHSAVHATGAREQVLADVAQRSIRFPGLADIKAPIRSTFTGRLIDPATENGSLVELMVDMILTQAVNWDKVVASLVEASPEGSAVRLLNIGPGAGLTRTMERAFPKGRVSSLDITSDEGKSNKEAAYKQEPIAIVGMAVNMPGAPSVSKLWEVLEQGINTISEVPSQRFNISEYNNPKDSKTKRTMKAHTGNFIEDPDVFDNKFFHISPREARSMDPQQRILLHTAYEALENAGYVPNATSSFQQDTFGCYVGVATEDYVKNLRDDIDVYYSTGTLRAFLSGRISYAMQFSGPSIVTDTACSSSIVTVYQACRALVNRDCNAALAGGVNVITSPDMMIGLDRGHFLSPTGQCKAFDASADGYSRSEGCGIFVLKRLSDAVAENDNILGVIRGVEVNQSGLAHSITHPHAPTQMQLFERLLERSGVDRNRINVVEAHGTGTQAGDPNELESIRGIFAAQRTPENPLHITSVKANIGHLEAASGAAGLAKLLLMLRHQTIPRQISLKNLNPTIAPLDADHTTIDRQACTWAPSREGLTRFAMLNNFGAAGSNGALLLEEFPSTSVAAVSQNTAFLFGLSAKSETALDELRSRYVEYLQSPASESTRFSDIAYTATARRQIYPYRLAVSASERSELIDKLSKASVKQANSKSAKTVFVFSGQGSQYLGMGSSLYRTSELFKRHIDDCHATLVALGFPGVLPIINSGTEGSGLAMLDEFQAYQAAIFSLEYALAQVWLSWGMKPDAVVGHSLGEYAALVTAGVITLKSALMLVGSRARLMVQKCAVESTGMIAVNLGPAAVSEVLKSSQAFAGLAIACYNSAVDCVVAGPLEELKSLKAHLDSEVHCKNIILTVPFGYHTTAMHPLVDDLTALAKGVTLRAPTIPVISNVLGDVVRVGDNTVFTADYFSRHCAQPVLFDKGVNAFLSNPEFADVAVWIEIGPHTTTLPMLKSNPALPKDALLLGSLRKQQDSWTTLTGTLCQLYTANVDLLWRHVFDHLSSVTCVDLPSYPFAKTKFWVDYNEIAQGESASVAAAPAESVQLVSEFSMLHSWTQFPSSANGRVAIFETPIRNLAGSIKGHSVGDHPLCPASVYHELALSGAQMARSHLATVPNDTYVVLRAVDYAKPLVYDEHVARTVRTTITVNDDASGSFSVSSRVEASSEELIHCFGEFLQQNTAQTVTKFHRYLPILSREIASITSPTNGAETFSTRTAYEIIFPRVVDYAKEYHTMQSLVVDSSGMEGYAVVKLPSDHDRGKFVVHPVFMDTLLHVAGFVANMQGGVNDAFICSQVDSVKVVPELIDNDATYGVVCRNAWLPDEGVMLADAYAVTLTSPQRIVAHLKRMHFRRVRLNSLRRVLSLAAGASSQPQPTKVVRVETTRTAPTQKKSVKPETSSQESSTDVQSEVLKVVAETCDIKVESLDLDADLSSLGVDSLMGIEIFGKLRSLFPHADLNSHTLSFCHTAAEIVKEVSSKTGGRSGTSSPTTLTPEDGNQVEDTPTVISTNDDIDVKAVMASVLGLSAQEIGDDSDFETLGLDSLTSIEALQALRNEFAMELPQHLFTTHTTVRAIQNFLSSHQQAQVKVAQFSQPSKVVEELNPGSATIVSALQLDTLPLALQQSKGSRNAPLFLIHDGSGLVNYYDRISALDRDVWGIHNPKFITSQPWDSVVAMASEYAALIAKTASGPVLIGGKCWSFGGVVAFEAARQMLKKGINVKGVVLIDSPSPVNHVPLSDALIDSVVNLDARSAKSEIGRLVKSQFQMNSRMLGTYDPLAAGGPYPPLVLLRSRDGFNASGVQSVPWLENRSNPQQAVAGWEGLVSTTVKMWDIPGNHFQPFIPSNIGEVSRRIADGCDHLERLSV